MTTTPARTRVGFVEVTLIVFGLYALGIGLFMMFAPGPFFDTLGTFGVRNDHYIFDNATFEIPQGLLLLAAVRRVSWRVPALAFATAALGAARDQPHHRPAPRCGRLDRLARGRRSGGDDRDPRNGVARQRRHGEGRALMRVLVAGATSVPGLPLLRELNSRGHEVVGVTRSSSKTSQIETAGAKTGGGRRLRRGRDRQGGRRHRTRGGRLPAHHAAEVGAQASQGLRAREEAVERGRTEPGRAPPNARACAGSSRSRWSSLTAIRHRGRDLMDETDPYPGPPPKGGEEMLAALRGMEQTVLTSGEHSDTEGIVLRYGDLLRAGCAARRIVHPDGEVVGDARADRKRHRVVGAHRRRREGNRGRGRERAGRADLQHRRRPAAVVRRLCA